MVKIYQEQAIQALMMELSTYSSKKKKKKIIIEQMESLEITLQFLCQPWRKPGPLNYVVSRRV